MMGASVCVVVVKCNLEATNACSLDMTVWLQAFPGAVERKV